MSGSTDLGQLLSAMRPQLGPMTYVFITQPHGAPPSFATEPLMTFREAEGMSYIIEQKGARAAGFDGSYPCKMISLNVHSSLSAVGFLAAITTRLAERGISVNPVSAFYHDHLFVPVELAEEAMDILSGFSA